MMRPFSATNRRQLGTVAMLLLLAMALPAARAASSSVCESLAEQKLPYTAITAAQAITTGSFVLPGMAHCSGGPGPNTFDMQAALEQWVERGIAPDRVVATHSVNGVVDRLRPLCPYPQTAVYKSTGDTNDDANFECRAAPPGQ